MKIKSQLFISSLKVLPKNYISWSFGKLAGTKFPKKTNQYIINKFAKLYNIDLSEAEFELDKYKSLNDFFTRRLKEGARKINKDENVLVSPCDGFISQMGNIDKNEILQVKGKNFTLETFLKDDKLAKKYYNGHYVTIYLSPKDYHRVHSPLKAKVNSYNYIKGKLFPVNNISVEHIPELFSVNERVVCNMIHDKIKEFSLIMVGATNVGSISLSFSKLRTNKILQKTKFKDLQNKNISLKKAQELGVFNMGSTVVLLFKKDSINLDFNLKNKTIKMGQKLGTLK